MHQGFPVGIPYLPLAVRPGAAHGGGVGYIEQELDPPGVAIIFRDSNAFGAAADKAFSVVPFMQGGAIGGIGALGVDKDLLMKASVMQAAGQFQEGQPFTKAAYHLVGRLLRHALHAVHVVCQGISPSPQFLCRSMFSSSIYTSR